MTGHEDPAKESADVDWEALAKAGGTLVILMGAGRVGDIAARLVAGGRPPETPVAAVRNGTRADQHTVRATLATIADAGVRAPAAIVVGEVAGLDLAWFETRPLFGRSVVVTRAREQASELRRRLEGLGAEVIELPAIAIEPLAFDVPDLDRVPLARLHVGERRGRVLRPRPRARPGSTPAPSRVSGSPPSDRGPPPPSPSAGCAPTCCPSGSWPSRCWRRSRRRRPTANACCSPGPSRRVTCFPPVCRSAATRSTCCRCTGP